MGCGASKTASTSTIVPSEPSSAPLQTSSKNLSTQNSTSFDAKNSAIAIPQIVPEKSASIDSFNDNKASSVENIGANSLLLSSTSGSKGPNYHARLRPIAFDIPIDNTNQKDGKTKLKLPPMLLPKLGLPNNLPRIHNSKVSLKMDNQLDKILVGSYSLNVKKGQFPRFDSSVSRDTSSIQLRQRLLEKESHAALNRAREIEKLQAKLARQESHARRVLERKKSLALGLIISSNVDDGLTGLLNSVSEKRGHSGAGFQSSKKVIEDTDSGIGTSRSGSGRSILENVKTII